MNGLKARGKVPKYPGKSGGGKLPLPLLIAICAGGLLIAALIAVIVLYFLPEPSAAVLPLPERTAYAAEAAEDPAPEAAPIATPTSTPEPTPAPAVLPAEAMDMITKYREVADEYEDCVGWIQLDGTTLSNAFFKSKDHEQYLNKNRDGKTYFEDGSRTQGEVFLDYHIKDLTDHDTYRNWVLYGHNLQKAKTFFSALHNYSDETYFREHGVIRVVTDEGYSEWRIAMFNPQIPENYKYRQVSFESDEEFVAYFTRCFGQSLWDAGITVTPQTRVMTLSTCDNDTSNDDYRSPAMYVLIPESVVPYDEMMEQYNNSR